MLIVEFELSVKRGEDVRGEMNNGNEVPMESNTVGVGM